MSDIESTIDGTAQGGTGVATNDAGGDEARLGTTDAGAAWVKRSQVIALEQRGENATRVFLASGQVIDVKDEIAAVAARLDFALPE